MEEFPGNSFSTKGSKKNERPPVEKPKVEKIVEGTVVRRKKSLGKKFAETFFGNAKNVWDFVLIDVMIPAARDTMVDAGKAYLEGIFYPDSVRRPRSARDRRDRHTPYDRVGSRGPVGYRRDERDRPRMSPRNRSKHNFDEIIVSKRAEAEGILQMLDDIIAQYGEATVENFYDMVGETSDYTDRNWGWRALPGAGVDRVSDGYVLDLPRPIPLDD